ncbi:MAG: outer membrane beta-barrel protein [Pseudomonadota bacterium]
MRFKKWIGIGSGIIIGLISNILYAAASPSLVKLRYCHPHRFYFDLGVGKAYDYARSNSFLESSNGAVLGNLRTGNSYSTPFFFVGIGYRWARPDLWFPSVNVGLQHRYTSPINVNGVSQTPSVDPAPTSYNYRMQQESWLIMTKADIYKWKGFMPYIAAGMGVSFNRISQFFVNSPIFANQLGGSTTLKGGFSYSFGAGIDYPVKEDFWLSLGYFYDDFGKNKIDSVFTSSTMNSIGTLKNANLHANSFFLSARYLFA